MLVNPRLRAVQVLLQVLQHHRPLQEVLKPEDSPLVYQLTFGSLRFYYQLLSFLEYALPKPLKEKDHDVFLLILLGFYQLQHLDIPDYAIVRETVEAAQLLKKNWAKSLINAVLRRFLREQEAFEKHAISSQSAQYAHPSWLIDEIKKAWPEHWQSILCANNEKPPMYLRVNRLKISREHYLALLQQTGIAAHPIMSTSEGIVLTEGTDVKNLPCFSEGMVSVQDAAAQYAADYLDLKPGLSVLDACAAPGGKTAHILERQPDLNILALDISEERLKKVKENLKRLKLNAHLLQADAALPSSWWDKKCFDRILLDAPCSATGVIRRHPDIKLLRTPNDIPKVVKKQQALLNALWPLLKQGGRLVYATCSILPQENHEMITDFLKTHDEAELVPLQSASNVSTPAGIQLLPGNTENTDGFYYAALQKV